MQTIPVIDVETLRRLVGPGSAWAEECGARVRERRRALGWTLERAAGASGTSFQVLSRVERGQLVPRDHLRAAIAFALGVEVSELWPPLSRRTIGERAVA